MLGCGIVSLVPEVRCFARGISSETCDRRGASHISHQGFAHNACQIEHQGILSLKYNAAAGTGGQYAATYIVYVFVFHQHSPKSVHLEISKDISSFEKVGNLGYTIE